MLESERMLSFTITSSKFVILRKELSKILFWKVRDLAYPLIINASLNLEFKTFISISLSTSMTLDPSTFTPSKVISYKGEF